MGKLTGSGLILAGCAALLMNWIENVRQRELCMKELVRMFCSWNYALETQRIRITDFLQQYPFEREELQKAMEEVRCILLTNTCPSGADIWREVLEKHKKSIGLPISAYEVLIQSEDGFFGTNSREASCCMTRCEAQMQQCIELERAKYREKRRVYLPVGMLTGVMLIILLI